MADNLKPEDRKRTMRAVRGKNTGLERSVASMLAGMHLRGWRKHAVELPGRPDIVFDSQHVAIFVDGCFWHGCPRCKRPLPKTNSDYWVRKIEANVNRAKGYDKHLGQMGWKVIRIYEHELKDRTLRSDTRQRIRQVVKR